MLLPGNRPRGSPIALLDSGGLTEQPESLALCLALSHNVSHVHVRPEHSIAFKLCMEHYTIKGVAEIGL